MPSLRPLVLTAFAAGGGLLAGCGGAQDEARSTVRVAVALYPLQEAAERIGGDRVQVDELTPVGGQPHGLEPSAAATDALRRAKVVLYLGGGFQPAVEAAVAKLPSTTAKIDLLGDVAPEAQPRPIPGVARSQVLGLAADPDGPDPHVWVDPARMVTLARTIQAALIKADPAGRGDFEARGAAYVRTLRALDASYRSGLAGCRGRTLLTTHPAFGYLAEDLGLRQAVTGGIVPGSEPDPDALRATGRYARSHGVTTLFLTVPPPSRLSAQIRRATGAATAVLNPVEGLTQDQLAARQGYVPLMQANLAALRQGLGCDGT